eukprot:2854840-Amphidinium_carterae.1
MHCTVGRIAYEVYILVRVGFAHSTNTLATFPSSCCEAWDSCFCACSKRYVRGLLKTSLLVLGICGKEPYVVLCHAVGHVLNGDNACSKAFKKQQN